MSQYLCFLILLLNCRFSISNTVSKSDSYSRQLQYVLAIWRHGDRAPKEKPYPSDPYDESFWPRGWAELTNDGMLQMRELGGFFRTRYVGDFISSNFSYREVSIISSHADRALVSAQSFLNGLYPPKSKDEYFDSNLAWQPIPVHTIGQADNDPYLEGYDFNCPAYKKLKKKAHKKLDKKLRPKYQKFYESLRSVIGNKKADIPLRKITKLSNIQREINHNLTQPNWVYKVWPEYENKTTIDILLELRDTERIVQFNTTELARLTTGLLLGDWITQLQRVVNQTLYNENLQQPSHMALYSSHEQTLIALQYALQATVKGKKSIPYAGCLILELYKVQQNGDIKFEIQACELDSCGVAAEDENDESVEEIEED